MKRVAGRRETAKLRDLLTQSGLPAGSIFDKIPLSMETKKPIVYVTRRAEFSASHRYYDPALSPADNEKLFGMGARPYGHGHNYVVELTVAGPVDPKTGIVHHTRLLKEALQSAIAEWDHQNLNELADFKGQMPTLENISRVLWMKLASNGAGKLGMQKIRVYEEPELFLDYEGN